VWRWLPLGSGRLPAGVVSLFPARAALRRATRSPPSAIRSPGKAFTPQPGELPRAYPTRRY
ncbi:hypothetical protein J5H79_24660, partial [Providencia rettgeri]|nr:hypothetical protein [Providencia rettgeri]